MMSMYFFFNLILAFIVANYGHATECQIFSRGPSQLITMVIGKEESYDPLMVIHRDITLFINV